MDKERTLALDIGGTRIKMAIIQNGEIIVSSVIPSMSDGNLADRLPYIKEELDKLTHAQYQEYCGLGIAMPCLVNPEKSIATEIYGKFEDAPQLDMVGWVRKSFGLPMIMEQDSRAALLGEVNFGVAKGFRDVVLVIMGTGVGTAVMIDGHLLNSRNHFAGSLGSHIIIEMNGKKCSCNGSGCLEAYTAGWALPGLIRNHPGFVGSVFEKEELLDYLALEHGILKNDVVAIEVLDTVVSAMRAGIISLIHAYDPSAVVLCGGPLNMGKMFTGPLLKDLSSCLWGNGNDVQYMISDQPDKSVLLGLHYLVVNNRKVRV